MTGEMDLLKATCKMLISACELVIQRLNEVRQERDTLRTQLVAVTAERDAVKRALEATHRAIDSFAENVETAERDRVERGRGDDPMETLLTQLGWWTLAFRAPLAALEPTP